MGRACDDAPDLTLTLTLTLTLIHSHFFAFQPIPHYLPRHKGHIFLDQQRGEQAVISYFQACSLERHIEAFRGLVDANLSLRKVGHYVI